eukprot:1217018-Pleurochrysis_carterae.AAC.3
MAYPSAHCYSGIRVRPILLCYSADGFPVERLTRSSLSDLTRRQESTGRPGDHPKADAQAKALAYYCNAAAARLKRDNRASTRQKNAYAQRRMAAARSTHRGDAQNEENEACCPRAAKLGFLAHSSLSVRRGHLAATCCTIFDATPRAGAMRIACRVKRMSGSRLPEDVVPCDDRPNRSPTQIRLGHPKKGHAIPRHCISRRQFATTLLLAVSSWR